MCWLLLQTADSGWYRHQQTVRVWHGTSSGGPLWEDRGSAPSAGRKSVHLSLFLSLRLFHVFTKATVV